jgi:predicted TPR repeat methyltransferase
MSVDLNQVAEVLEKTADYIEAVEAAKIAEDQQVRTKAASALAEKLTDATGEAFDETMVNKLAGLEPEVTDVLAKLAGAGSVDSLGGPKEDSSVKTASDGVSPATQRFEEWLTSE